MKFAGLHILLLFATLAAVGPLAAAAGNVLSDAARTLRECGLDPEAVRKSPFWTDFKSLAAVSMVMSNENSAFGDLLRKFAATNDFSTRDEMTQEVYDRALRIAAGAAKCGAAYGVVMAH